MSAYLYIFEDGSSVQSVKPPSEDEDFQEVLQGTLQVYRWNGQAIEQLECTEEAANPDDEGEELEEEPETTITPEWVSVKTR